MSKTRPIVSKGASLNEMSINISNKATADCQLGLGEILEKMEFCNWNSASYVFGSKIQL